MNANIEELTVALQQVEAPADKGAHAVPPQLPAAIDPGELALSPEIEAFLNKRQEYSEKTRHVSVGTY